MADIVELERLELEELAVLELEVEPELDVELEFEFEEEPELEEELEFELEFEFEFDVVEETVLCEEEPFPDEEVPSDPPHPITTARSSRHRPMIPRRATFTRIVKSS